MENGADPMIPNNDNKETAFHYCGKSGNSEVNVSNYVPCFSILIIYFSRL